MEYRGHILIVMAMAFLLVPLSLLKGPDAATDDRALQPAAIETAVQVACIAPTGAGSDTTTCTPDQQDAILLAAR